MSAQHLEALRRLYPQLEVLESGGRVLPLIPGISLNLRSGLVSFDALLYPYESNGYETRLYVSKRLTPPEANNWATHQVCGDTWWACSWRGVPATLQWSQILAAHLGAFK